MEIQKSEYLENEKGSLDEIKNILLSFKGLSFSEMENFDKKQHTQALSFLPLSLLYQDMQIFSDNKGEEIGYMQNKKTFNS